MGSIEPLMNTTTEDDDNAYLFAMQLAVSSVLPMVMQQAIELNVFNIINKAGKGAHLSPTQIASHLNTQNPEAPLMLDRLLRLLAHHSILTCSFLTKHDGNIERLYGLTPVCKYYIPDEDGVCLFPWMKWVQANENVRCFYQLKDAVLEGRTAFEKEHGLGIFEYIAENRKYSDLFNGGMHVHTSFIMKKIVEVYKGFEGYKVLVDVGGGIGTMSKIVVSKYPAIKCINFDLPHVIRGAISHPGIENVGGDMFTSIPKADVVFMKCILHDWDDEHCLALLKNCYEALPDNGMVIVVEMIISTTDELENGVAELDVCMMMMCPGGKERRIDDFERLAKGAGFGGMKKICSFSDYWLMEFNKEKSH